MYQAQSTSLMQQQQQERSQNNRYGKGKQHRQVPRRPQSSALHQSQNKNNSMQIKSQAYNQTKLQKKTSYISKQLSMISHGNWNQETAPYTSTIQSIQRPRVSQEKLLTEHDTSVNQNQHLQSIQQGAVDSFFDDVSIQIIQHDDYDLDAYEDKCKRDNRKLRNERLHSIVKQIDGYHKQIESQKQIQLQQRFSRQRSINITEKQLQSRFSTKNILKAVTNKQMSHIQAAQSLASLNDSIIQQNPLIQLIGTKEEDEKMNEDLTYPELLKDIMETQKRFEALKEHNDVQEIGDLFKITKQNLSQYSGFINKIKNNLTNLNKFMIKKEQEHNIPLSNLKRDSSTNSLNQGFKAHQNKNQASLNRNNRSANQSPRVLIRKSSVKKIDRPFSAVGNYQSMNIDAKRKQHLLGNNSLMLQRSTTTFKEKGKRKQHSEYDNSESEIQMFYSSKNESFVNLPSNVSLKIKNQLINRAQQDQSKQSMHEYNLVTKPYRQLDKDQVTSSISIVKNLSRINNEIQLFSHNLEQHCKDNIRHSYNNLHNFDNKQVGLNQLALRRAQLQLQNPDINLSHPKAIRQQQTLQLDPTYVEMEQAKNGKDYHEDTDKKMFTRESKSFEQQRLFRNSTRKNKNKAVGNLNLPSDQELENEDNNYRDSIEITNIGINLGGSKNKNGLGNKRRPSVKF
ncbi:UNKNOWN [Stylonychia lemnae]|uniref:Uncharacterized protein n=1 Tax=Stylonychia lemnae TaxID=5949 RepID=A0A078A0C4_STYLE|nr:UNKNOWN [Stylonychia lemnae]|eukprot:CDW74233.1 UNKNOWN [Stylonychia lemnae]